MFDGIAVFLVMTMVVLPLSGLHAGGPYQLRGLHRFIGAQGRFAAWLSALHQSLESAVWRNQAGHRIALLECLA